MGKELALLLKRRRNVGVGGEHSLLMVLVHRTVGSDGGAKLLGRLVVADLPQHGGERGSAQVSSARGHDLTRPPSGSAVQGGRVQTQSPERLFCTRQAFLITASQSEDTNIKLCTSGSLSHTHSLVTVDGVDVAGLEAAGGEELR